MYTKNASAKHTRPRRALISPSAEASVFALPRQASHSSSTLCAERKTALRESSRHQPKTTVSITHARRALKDHDRTPVVFRPHDLLEPQLSRNMQRGKMIRTNDARHPVARVFPLFPREHGSHCLFRDPLSVRRGRQHPARLQRPLDRGTDSSTKILEPHLTNESTCRPIFDRPVSKPQTLPRPHLPQKARPSRFP